MYNLMTTLTLPSMLGAVKGVSALPKSPRYGRNKGDRPLAFDSKSETRLNGAASRLLYSTAAGARQR